MDDKFVSRAHQRAELRKAMPNAAPLVDAIRAAFPGARLTYVEEGAVRVGKKLEFDTVGRAHDGAIIVKQRRLEQ